MINRPVEAALASYFLGAIPTSYWMVKAVKGIDLRTVGSGNLGATNLYRVLGWRFAVPVALFDIVKGAIPVAVFGPWAGMNHIESLLLGAIAVLGHVLSVFVGFKGGKGVATGGGVVLGLAPWAFAVTTVLWAITVRISGYVSLGSLVAAAALPPTVWFLYPDRRETVLWLGLLTLAVAWLHRKNIARLINRTEHRFGKHPPGISRGTA